MGEPMDDASRVEIRQRIIAGIDPQTSQKIRTQLVYRMHNSIRGYFGQYSTIEDWKKKIIQSLFLLWLVIYLKMFI